MPRSSGGMGIRPLPPTPAQAQASTNGPFASKPNSRDDWSTMDARVRAHQIALGRASPSPSGQFPMSRDGGFPDWDAEQPQGWSRQRSSSISGSDGYRSGSGSGPGRFTVGDPGGLAGGLATMRRGATPQRGMMSSASVSNLAHQQQQQHQHPHPAHFGMMQQAQSMAHLGCPSCSCLPSAVAPNPMWMEQQMAAQMAAQMAPWDGSTLHRHNSMGVLWGGMG
ncbi:hypothetical protein FOCC_FOCC002769, partial [Frankliniella occidentalis]